MVQTIAYPLLVDRCLHRPARVPVRSIARPVAVMLLVFVATAALGDRLLMRHWLEWAFGVIASLPLILGVAFAAGLPAEARRTVVDRWRTMVAARG